MLYAAIMGPSFINRWTSSALEDYMTTFPDPGDSTQQHPQDIATDYGTISSLDVDIFPTPLQQSAVVILQSFEHVTVFAWLSLLRSLEPGYNYCARPGSLSSQDFESLLNLKGCRFDLVLPWLRTTRSGRTNVLLILH